MPDLSHEEQLHCASLEAKFQLIRDRVVAVASGYATGFYLFGEGGLGKSHIVLDELYRLTADLYLSNSRMTGRGLFDALARRPSSIHVLEDMESIMRDRNAHGVLRSALWSQRKPTGRGPLERLVTWSTAHLEHSVVFTGGIIMIANRPLDDVLELQALKTRIPYMQLHVTVYELRALMRSVALQGFQHGDQHLPPADCIEVCEFVIAESMNRGRSLDMRLLVNSFLDYLMWQEDETGCHWRDLVSARLNERPTAFQAPVAIGGREARKKQEQAIVHEILRATQDHDERIRLWTERTGKSQASFYRRMAELTPQPRLSICEN